VCLLFLLRERIGYKSTPDPVSIVCLKERFDYVSTSTPISVVCVIYRFYYVITPTPVYIILVEGKDWLCEYSYSCVYCLCKR